jgi:hypothetical protein
MDIGKSFSYVFEDKDWVKKVAIGGLLTLVPIVNFIPSGYGLRVLKNVSEAKERPLPEWDDWGGDFLKGLMIVVASLIYAIPIFILQAFSFAVSAVAGSSGSSDAQGALGVCLFGLSCLYALWGLAMGIVLPAATAKYARSGEFASFFRFGDIFRFIGANLGDYIIALLLSLAAVIVAAVAGSILCVIGLIFTMFWASMVSMHLLGQIGAEPTPPATVTPEVPTSGPSYGELTQVDLSAPKDDKPANES